MTEDDVLYTKWFANWSDNRTERLGQAFVNDFIRIPWPDLYYCTDDVIASREIYKYLERHCYWPFMPLKAKE